MSRRWAIITFIAFAAISAWAGIAGQGFLEADGATHYLYARFASTHPYLFVNIWGRPLVTGLYALPAMLGGRAAVRLTSLAVALACGGATLRVAIGQRYRLPVIAVIFLFAQPMFFLHSAAELTELPFALLVILSLWAYQRQRFFLLAVCIAIMPLGRPEAFGFMMAAIVAFTLHRKPWWILVLPIPLVLWSWVGWVAYGLPSDMKWWQWLIREWPYEAQSNYGHGPIWWYVAFMPAIVGPLLLPAALAGGLWCWRNGRLFGGWTLPVLRAPVDAFPKAHGSAVGSAAAIDDRALVDDPTHGRAVGFQNTNDLSSSHRRRVDFVIAALPFGILLVHSVFWFFGKFSGGELRYLLIVGPLWALTAARGWEWIGQHWLDRRLLASAIALALLPIATNKFYTAVPIRPSEPEELATHLARWYRADPQAASLYPNLLSPQPMFYYQMDRCPWKDIGVIEWTRDNVEHPVDGTLMVYDPILATYNSDSKLLAGDPSLAAGGWVLYRTFADGWKIYLSPRDTHGTPSLIDSIADQP